MEGHLNALETELPILIQAHGGSGDFWAAFAGLADVIEDNAGAHQELVAQRISAMLTRHGIACEDEPG
ncbi:hypothetical protein [Stenotrophomonas sp.]|uniref:hypothetical protein n=1 Tax=Stenotrophomonas sp. TaxID=69392 RepID=UPI0028AC2710|nr:hypothetical protein [Stenotrophomonas sp.]